MSRQPISSIPRQGPGGGPNRVFIRERPKQTKKTFFRIIHYLGGNPLLLILAISLVIAGSLANVAATWYLKPLINGLKPGVKLSGLAGSLMTMAAIYVSSALLAYLGNLLMVRLAQGTSNKIRKELFDHIMDLPIHFFDSRSHGEIMSRFTNDVDNVNIALEQSLSQTISSSITVVGVFVMMLFLSPLLTIFVIIMLILMIAIIRSVGSRSSRYFREQQKSLGKLNGIIEEMMEGQKVIKVFNHEEQAKADFRKENDTLRKAAVEAQTYAGILMPIIGNLSYAHYAVTVMVGALLAINGKMDVGTIAAFLQYTRSFSMPITQIANQFNSLLAALAGAERIFDILDTLKEADEGTVQVVENGKDDWKWKVPSEDGSISFIPVKGDIRFHNVTFGYALERDVLKSLTLFAKPGQKIAFVGSTGAGKTTITNLINRFYDIQSGKITYDSIDIKQIRKCDLRRTLGMVLQDVHLFQGTIRENIRYGNLHASDEDIINAAKLANAHSFIILLEHGYDTVLLPDGVNLSQGQRQLLSIARAAVANPPVLILDEATSSVDTYTERLIETGMGQLMQGRTTLAIAHRLSTVRNANAIMVMENGEITERGTHKDLLELQGRYYQLYTGAVELM